jgi:hypothetical protein
MAAYAIELYGVQRFFADLDRDRDFGDESVTGSLLNWVTHEGWAEFSEHAEWEFDSALEFRQRHIIQALKQR